MSLGKRINTALSFPFLAILIFLRFKQIVSSVLNNSTTNCSLCYHFNLDYAFNFPKKGVNDFVTLSGMPKSLTEFTVCLWMSSTNSQGSLFSYAVSGENNEMLLYYDKYFQMDIGGENRLCIFYKTTRKLFIILTINLINYFYFYYMVLQILCLTYLNVMSVTANMLVCNVTVPKFASSQSEARSTVLISCDIKSLT